MGGWKEYLGLLFDGGKGRKKNWEWGNFQAGYEMIPGGKAKSFAGT
jgi:hypothetical protein